jgi:general secretion pathway protein D
MMRILEDVDVGGVGDQIWIEPIHYGIASDIAQRLDEVFDIKAGASRGGGKACEPGPRGSRAATSTSRFSDDRSNSLVIIATERAYLRILEFIKRLDVPQHRGGRDPRAHAAARRRDGARKTLNDIITGGGRGRGAAAAGRGQRPLDDLRVAASR